MSITIARVIAGALAASAAWVGAWALVWPHSFYADFPGLGQVWVEPLGPYNEHLVRDVGGLYLALLVVSGWAAVNGEAGPFRATGVAWLAFGLPHLAFHAGHRQGFSDFDWVASLTPLAAAAVAAALLLFTRGKPAADAMRVVPREKASA